MGQKWFSVLKNKYLLTGLGFLVWVLFFDDDNFFDQRKRHRELNELKQRQAFLQKETQKELELAEQLSNNRQTVEKMARELYFMKKSNEIVYIEE
jgi:cell division protein DivIC